MLFLVLFLILALVAAACWFQGLWSNAIIIVNMTFAGLIATNFYEPLSDLFESFDRSFVYLVDLVSFWLIFAISYGILRLITDKLSKTKIEFAMPVEMAGRTILSIWAGWLFVCLTAFSIQFSPVGAEPMGSLSDPDSKSFLFLSPEKQWISFANWRSRGALSRGIFNDALISDDDRTWKAQVFDSKGQFLNRHHQRRKNLQEVDGLRVNR
jgi:hypothetical protein